MPGYWRSIVDGINQGLLNILLEYSVGIRGRTDWLTACASPATLQWRWWEILTKGRYICSLGWDNGTFKDSVITVEPFTIGPTKYAKELKEILKLMERFYTNLETMPLWKCCNRKHGVCVRGSLRDFRNDKTSEFFANGQESRFPTRLMMNNNEKCYQFFEDYLGTRYSLVRLSFSLTHHWNTVGRLSPTVTLQARPGTSLTVLVRLCMFVCLLRHRMRIYTRDTWSWSFGSSAFVFLQFFFLDRKNGYSPTPHSWNNVKYG